MAGGRSCDHVPGLVSRETAKSFAEFEHNYDKIHPYLTILICLLGILSNSASMAVFTRKNMMSSSSIILAWLSLNNVVFMMYYIPYLAYFYTVNTGPYGTSPYYFWAWYFRLYFLFLMLQENSCWLNVALAVFRFIYLTFPTKAKLFCTKQIAMYVSVIIFVVNFLIRAQKQIMLTVVYGHGRAIALDKSSTTTPSIMLINTTYNNITFTNNDTSIQQENSNAFRGFYYTKYTKPRTSFHRIFDVWIHNLMRWVPALAIVIAIALLVSTLRESVNRKRLILIINNAIPKPHRDSKEEKYVTFMFLAIVSLRALTEVPLGAMVSIISIYPCFLFAVFFPLSNFINMINMVMHTINIILYICVDKVFRNTFLELFSELTGFTRILSDTTRTSNVIGRFY